jgi:hypothetical protein
MSLDITSNNVNLWQSWDNLIDFIKGQLGAPVLNIELNDDDILNIIKKHIIPIYSRYDPLLMYYLMFEETNCIKNGPTKIYQIKDFPYAIMRVDDIIPKPGFTDLNQSLNTALYSGDITNFLGSNYVNQSKLEVLAQDTYRFLPPDKIELIKANNSTWLYNDFILKLGCVHDNPSTVNPDMYEYLKQLSLAEIMIRLGRIRTKFQSFQTPAGQIDLTSQELLQEGQQLKKEILQELDRMPPDHFLAFLN